MCAVGLLRHKGSDDVTNDELLERYQAAKYILEISYGQLERYDEKTNQLLALIGIDFTVLGIFASFLFANATSVSMMIRVFFIILVPAALVFIIIALYAVKKTLSPHLKPVDRKQKEKNGLIFFMDIDTAFSKEEYVDTLIGNRHLKDSKRYQSTDADSFIKCMIEDCAYDIYEQAAILRLKSSNLKKSYRWVFVSTFITFVTVVLLCALTFLGF